MNYFRFSSISALLFLGCSMPIISQSKWEKSNATGKTVEVYSTVRNSDTRLTVTGKEVFQETTQPIEREVYVFVNPDKTFQSLLGIGGAITDASAEVFARLPETKQQEFIKACFGNEGNNYSLLRTNIHSCDFSSSSYTYIDEGDAELKSFSIEHDKKFRIPMIKQAFEIAGRELVFYASPWSPPAFMKDNNDLLHGGKLLPKYYQSWANYYVKFIKAYEQQGLPVWGITLQNEPMAVQQWESCIFTAEEERDFLKNYLGPTLRREGLRDKKIVVWDHNRDLLSHRADVIFSDPEAARYAWGIGFHWYETWKGGQPKFDNVANVRESYPDKNLLFTEGCVERFKTENLQRWSNAERYGESMMNDFNNGTVGWTDWNILLDETGGPNHVGNFCFAPVHGNTKTGELIYTPSYYYIGHFSRFIRPKALRVSTVTSFSTLMSTSFMNPDGTIATVVMNTSDESIPYKLCIGKSAATLEIPAHSIQTLVY
jgi:glucosylceramidase